MNAFWGDDSWRSAAYATKPDLFSEHEEKVSNTEIARGFCQHLRKDARFSYVPDPLPMRNGTGAVVYYLVFASRKPVAEKIVRDIFAKYHDRGR